MLGCLSQVVVCTCPVFVILNASVEVFFRVECVLNRSTYISLCKDWLRVLAVGRILCKRIKFGLA